MAQLTGGQALAQSLVREGIDTIFLLPGVQLDWALDALYDEQDAITLYHTRHEQATAYMADGYARTTGKIGTAMVVPGPGLLNATAALSTAYACSSPVLCVTGQINSRMIEQGVGQLHEIPNQLGMIGAVTKWAGRAMTPTEVPALVREAFRQLRSGRPRPVEIEIPPDILAMTGEVELLDRAPVERSAGDPDLLKRAADALRKAERPVICVGGGVLSSEAWPELRELAQMLEAPVVMSSNARGALSDRDYRAQTGLSGQKLLPEADVVLAVGTRFVHPKEWGLAEGATVLRIDADEREVARAPQPAVGIVGDAKAGLVALVAALVLQPHFGDRLLGTERSLSSCVSLPSPLPLTPSMLRSRRALVAPKYALVPAATSTVCSPRSRARMAGNSLKPSVSVPPMACSACSMPPTGTRMPCATISNGTW